MSEFFIHYAYQAISHKSIYSHQIKVSDFIFLSPTPAYAAMPVMNILIFYIYPMLFQPTLRLQSIGHINGSISMRISTAGFLNYPTPRKLHRDLSTEPYLGVRMCNF